jgi:predicted transposase/invertase (TIGR01784 family)
MFDPVCKFLVESFPTDFATWLLGKPIKLTELSPSELSLEPIRADALILLQSESVVLHLEFQTQAKPDIPFRMLDYRLRVYRRFPHRRMRQIVIYLYPTSSELVYQTSFVVENTRHEFEVIRLWEQPTELFLETSALLPLAVLTQATNKTQILRQVAEKIEQIPETRIQSNITGSTFVLAGLVLKRDIIGKILKRDIMRESTTYQWIIEEGLEEGRKEGLQQGLQQGEDKERLRVVLNLLNEGVAVDFIVRVTGLSIEEIRQIQADREQN